MLSRQLFLVVAAAALFSSPTARAVQAPSAPKGASAPKPSADTKSSPEQVKAAVSRLGAFEFPIRMEAGRVIRRAEPSVAVPALLEAVNNPGADWYVRFRSLVLLSGFRDPRTPEVMTKLLDDRNDRLRAVAYSWFERNPTPSVLPRLLAALKTEESEFVRPALTRALAAYGTDPKVQQVMSGLVMRGQDLFRAVVIEALGEHKAAYALQPIITVAKIEGPLQDDAVLAIGRIGDKRGLAVLAELQQKASRNLQPSIAAAICLLGSNCDSHSRYLMETLTFGIENPGFQELLRAAAGGLAALASAGKVDALKALIDQGAPTRDPERAPIALALGSVALRTPSILLQELETRSDLVPAIELLREAFDMLEEDFDEEQFYATVRRAYWAAPAGSATRKVAQALIDRLEF